MEANIYHSKIGFPRSYRRPVGTMALNASRHAEQRGNDWGVIIPTSINMRDAKVFEIGMECGKLTKIAVRTSYDSQSDICLVIGIRNGRYSIITLWLNAVDDEHYTLNFSRYSRP